MAGFTSTDFLASFDITDKTQIYDISPVLLAALMNDTGVLGLLPVGTPATDTTHYWNKIALNSGTITVDGTGYATTTDVAPSFVSTAGVRVGAILVNLTAGDTQDVLEKCYVSAVTDATTLAVTRSYGGTTASTFTFKASTVVNIMALPLNEGSDIQADSTTVPGVTSNYTQILERSITITRNQMKRPMAAIADMLVQSIHNRTMEIKRELELSVIHGVANNTAGAGTDAQVRTMNGLLSSITQTSVIATTTLTYAIVNSFVKSIVDAGAADDISRLALVAPTPVRQTISAFDSSNRRLVESDRRQGYFVEQIVSDLGVVLDVATSNYLGNSTPTRIAVVDCGRASLHPFQDDSFKIMAAQDWVDGVKRRILGEWTLEVRNPDAAHFKAVVKL